MDVPVQSKAVGPNRCAALLALGLPLAGRERNLIRSGLARGLDDSNIVRGGALASAATGCCHYGNILINGLLIGFQTEVYYLVDSNSAPEQPVSCC